MTLWLNLFRSENWWETGLDMKAFSCPKLDGLGLDMFLYRWIDQLLWLGLFHGLYFDGSFAVDLSNVNVISTALFMFSSPDAELLR